jgi:hypothetical protein
MMLIDCDDEEIHSELLELIQICEKLADLVERRATRPESRHAL